MIRGSYNPFITPDASATIPMCQPGGGQPVFMAMPYPQGGGAAPMMYMPTGGGGMTMMMQPMMVPMMVPMPQYFGDPMAQAAGSTMFSSPPAFSNSKHSPPPAYHPAPASSSILPMPGVQRGQRATSTNAALLPIPRDPLAFLGSSAASVPHQQHVFNPSVAAYKPQASSDRSDVGGAAPAVVSPADAFVCVLCGSQWEGCSPPTSERRPFVVRIARHVDRRLAKVIRGCPSATKSDGTAWSTSERQVVLILVNAMPDASILNECVWEAMRAAHYCSNCVVREVTLQPKAVSAQLKESINFPDDLVHIQDDGRRVVLPHILLPASAAVRLADELNKRWRVDRYDPTVVQAMWVPCDHPAPSLNRDSDYAVVL